MMLRKQIKSMWECSSSLSARLCAACVSLSQKRLISPAPPLLSSVHRCDCAKALCVCVCAQNVVQYF